MGYCKRWGFVTVRKSPSWVMAVKCWCWWQVRPASRVEQRDSDWSRSEKGIPTISEFFIARKLGCTTQSSLVMSFVGAATAADGALHPLSYNHLVAFEHWNSSVIIWGHLIILSVQFSTIYEFCIDSCITQRYGSFTRWSLRLIWNRKHLAPCWPTISIPYLHASEISVFVLPYSY